MGTQHIKISLDTNELVEALYSAVEARDLPGMADVDASLLLFCKEIKKHVTVALSGECADEIFGGYPWYRDKSIRETDGLESLLQSSRAVPWYGQLMTTPQTIAYFLQINYWLQKYQIHVVING